ncbi:CpaD family pilus assembly protein [Allopontixanthobacter sediminis]|uniref:Pilus assembly protein CpaD n=1 Tax=Allopontixanthobacter sediminis TaxID=1689985 RepID=A0A845B089_9SPHN|nr:CpaD family pilus assembly protein [Allopontixanthobacter sediminis]MXP45143.1 pilus assembly protein CpaD [Allopontixanthobacter sediminis]
MPIATHRKLTGVLALSLGLALSACGGMPSNRGLDSMRQPVVERTNFTLDVQAGAGGLSISEQQRLAAWFETLDLRYGDRISIDDPMMSQATREVVSKLAGRHGVLVEEGAPVTAGYVEPGAARVVVTRSTASVPGCPDWSETSDANFNNATRANYGCATNSNLAAMVANPEDLITGQKGTGETVVTTSTKAIASYRKQVPTGEGGLAQTTSGAE